MRRAGDQVPLGGRSRPSSRSLVWRDTGKESPTLHWPARVEDAFEAGGDLRGRALDALDAAAGGDEAGLDRLADVL